MTLKELLDVVEPETTVQLNYRITGRLNGSLRFRADANDETDEVLETFGERLVKGVGTIYFTVATASDLVVEVD